MNNSVNRINVPNIRFPGFFDDWEQRKLGDTVSLRGRIGFRGYTQADLVEKGNGAITFSPSDIDDAGNVSQTNNKYISWAKYEESPEIKVQPGDILFTKTASIGKVGFVRELKEKATINPQFALLTPLDGTDGYFTFLAVRTKGFMKQVRDITGGSSVPTMSQEKLKELTFMAPSLNEQNKLGEFFENIDKVITLHQHKCDQLKEYKKGILQKVFPREGKTIPEIRFSDYMDSWKQYKLGEVLDDMYNGQTPSRLKDDYWNGNINWLSSGELNRGKVFSSTETITEAGQKSANLRIIPSGTFVMAITGLEAAGTRGNCAILGFNTTINQSCMALFPKKELLTPEFLFQWYRFIGESYGIRYTQGTKQQSYNAETISGLDICLPKIEEQKRITDFLEKIDNLITFYHCKCDQLKEHKKGLLQQMFL